MDESVRERWNDQETRESLRDEVLVVFPERDGIVISRDDRYANWPRIYRRTRATAGRPAEAPYATSNRFVGPLRFVRDDEHRCYDVKWSLSYINVDLADANVPFAFPRGWTSLLPVPGTTGRIVTSNHRTMLMKRDLGDTLTRITYRLAYEENVELR